MHHYHEVEMNVYKIDLAQSGLNVDEGRREINDLVANLHELVCNPNMQCMLLHVALIGQEQGDGEQSLSGAPINPNSMCHKEEHQGLISMHVDSMQQGGQEDAMHPKLSKDKYGSASSNAFDTNTSLRQQ